MWSSYWPSGMTRAGTSSREKATVVAGRAAAALGGGHERIDLSGGQVVAVVHRFVYCWSAWGVLNLLKIKGRVDGHETKWLKLSSVPSPHGMLPLGVW